MQALRRNARVLIPLVAVGIAVSSIDCAAGHSAAVKLDRVAASLDKYGSLSISGAVLIEPDPRFQLDLELTGNQIFERNRIEGFSNISQFDAVDMQLSVKAEVVQNLIDQMAGTKEPGVLQKLKQQLMAAAFQGLLGSLPEEQRQPFKDLLKPIPNVEQTSSDGGQGKILEAEALLAEAKEARGRVEAATDADTAKQEANATFDKSKSMGRSARAAVVEALNFAAEAERKIATAPAEERNQSGEAIALITAAREAATAARDAVDALMPRLDEDQSALDGKTEQEIKALVAPYFEAPSTATQPADSQTLPEVLDLARTAVTKGRQAGAIAGLPIGPTRTPQQQKILEAEQIDQERRLALKRLPEFRPVLENYEGPLDMNLRQLLILTASDKITLEMLRWLSYPRGYGPGNRVFLMMASVNVKPGQITYDGYMGQVEMLMEYGRRIALSDTGNPDTAKSVVVGDVCTDSRNAQCKRDQRADTTLARDLVRAPNAFTVFPFIDSQVLDLRTSRRQAFTLAMQLVVNGYPAAANMLLDIARQREQDIETVTGINTVTSYSSGRRIGFTFSPRVVAQGDPTNIDTRPMMNLQPQTIPVLIAIVCDEDDLVPKNSRGATHLRTFQVHRWVRAPRPSSDEWPFGRWLSQLNHPRLSEVEMRQRAQDLDEAREYFNEGILDVQAPDTKASLTEEERNELRRDYSGKILAERRKSRWSKNPDRPAERLWLETRLGSYESEAIGSDRYFRLPIWPSSQGAAGEDCALAVRPTRGWVNRDNTFFVRAPEGQRIFAGDFDVSIGGRRANATYLTDSSIRVFLPAWMETFDYESVKALKEDANYKACVAVATPKGVFTSDEIEFTYYAPTPQTASTEKHAVGAEPSPFGKITAKVDPQHIHVVFAENEAQPIRVLLSEPVSIDWAKLYFGPVADTNTRVLRMTPKTESVLEFPVSPKTGDEYDPPKAELPAFDTVHKDLTLVIQLKGGGKLELKVSGELTLKAK